MRRTDLAGWLFSAPALVGIGMFLIAPFVVSIYLSLTNQRFVSPNPPVFVGAENYRNLLALSLLTIEPLPDAPGTFPRTRDLIRADPELRGYSEWFSVDLGGYRHAVLARDPVFMRSLVNNFHFTLMVVPLQCGLALALALLVNLPLAGSRLFRTIYFMPVVTSMAVISVVWILIYNPAVGLQYRVIGLATPGGPVRIDWLGDTGTAMLAILIMSVWQGVGFQMVLFLAGLQGIPRDLYEAAKIDGANAWQRFRFVTWPGLRNTTAFVVITTTIASFRLFTQVDVMTQGGPRNDATSTVIFHAIQEGFRSLKLGYGSAISVVFFLVVLAVTFILRRITRPIT